VSSGSEGVRRLSIFVGALCGFLYIFLFASGGGFPELSFSHWFSWWIFVSPLLVWFLAGWGVTRVAAWVVRALQKDREE
jgi:hypothetical protein